QAGATWKPTDRTSVTGGLSWLADSAAGSADGNPTLPLATNRSRNPLGYSLALEQRAGRNTTVAASLSSRPISYDAEVLGRGPTPGSLEHPIYVSDGEAASREAGVELRRRFGPLLTRSGASWGRIDGVFAAAMPGEPLTSMRDGRL